MPKDEFLIGELAKRANVTPRTIRYYTDEGLLPPPEVRGKYAYYTDEHLDRLELISRLKSRHLPLREIRQTLGALPQAEIREVLRMQDELIKHPLEPRKPVKFNQVGELDSAREYITNLMNKSRDDKGEVISLESRKFYADPSRTNIAAELLPQPETRWVRIEIIPGVELHVEEQLATSLKERVRKVVEFAKGSFRK